MRDFSRQENYFGEAKLSRLAILADASTCFHKPANNAGFLEETKKIDWTIKAWQLESWDTSCYSWHIETAHPRMH
jgi:hypothetical protein